MSFSPSQPDPDFRERRSTQSNTRWMGSERRHSGNSPVLDRPEFVVVQPVRPSIDPDAPLTANEWIKKIKVIEVAPPSPTPVPPPAHRNARTWILFACLLILATAVLMDRWAPPYGALSRLFPYTPAAATPAFSPAVLERTYKGLVNTHWSQRTGLFLSFIDTGDRKLIQQASTYDQAVAGLLALEVGDNARVRGLLDFYRKAWETGPKRTGPHHNVYGLANFYNAIFGGEGIEKTIHLGPNAWIGLFAARAANRIGDPDALALAVSIANWAQRLPASLGGRAMGPVVGLDGVPWTRVYSTENNISYWAFLNELRKSPRLTPAYRERLAQEQYRVERWLVNISYDRKTGEMLRGVNPSGRDHTQALDTYSWLLIALGPQALRGRGIDPNELFNKARKRFITRVDGRLAVDCTDAAEAERTSRSEKEPAAKRPAANHYRLQWNEGQGQMVQLFESTRDASKRGLLPELKDIAAPEWWLRWTWKRTGQKLMANIDRRITPAPYEGAVVGATQGRFYQDGWPMANPLAPSIPVTALAASGWRLFTKMHYEPLLGTYLLAPKVSYSRALPELAGVQGNFPLLYGASAEMANHAWYLYSDRAYDLAKRQAEVTIREWEPWARHLERQKLLEIGLLIPDNGSGLVRQRIHDFWALNDVAASHYILALIAEHEGRSKEAFGHLQIIRDRYFLAQIWDSRGWYWSPMEALKWDFYVKNPGLYGPLTDLREEHRRLLTSSIRRNKSKTVRPVDNTGYQPDAQAPVLPISKIILSAMIP